MELGMIGLGRMGANMTERLLRDGHRVISYDRSPEAIQRRIDRIPAGRLATPEDCAAAVIHLAAADMGYVTGQILYLEGGFLSAGVLAR